MNERGLLDSRVCCLCVALLAFGWLLCGCSWYNESFVHLPPQSVSVHDIEPLDGALEERAADSASRGLAETAPNDPRPDHGAGNPPMPPEELTLRIEDCRATALEQNLSIRAAVVDPLIVGEGVNEEEARFEAVFTADLSYATTDTPTATTLSGSRAHQLRMDTGVEMPLRTGGTLSFDLADRRTKTNNVFSTLNPAYENDITVSISQPLLRNAGRRTSTHGIRLAVYEREVVNAATRLEIIRVLTAVDRVYWRLYAARRVLEVRKQDYDLAQSQLDTAQRFVDAGERSQVEVVRAEAALASRLEGIISGN
jgi:outer membrane protein TolC